MVLIVGAGLGGLLLGALLEKAGVPYNIFERATVVKPLGMLTFSSPTLLSFPHLPAPLSYYLMLTLAIWHHKTERNGYIRK